MKKIILLFILCFSLSFSADAVNLDSLYAVWQDETKSDTVRVYAYNNYIWYGVLSNNPDSAFQLAEELLAFAQEKKYAGGKSTAYHIQGTSFYSRGNYPKAVDYFSKELKIEQKLGDKRGIAAVLNNLGNIYHIQANYPKALDYYTRSLKIKEEVGDINNSASSLLNIGSIYTSQGNYTKALEYCKRGLKIQEKNGNKSGIASSHYNIGNIYFMKKEYPKALNYYNRSLKIKDEIGDKGGIISLLISLGDIHYEQGNYPKAMDYFERSIKLGREIDDKSSLAYAHWGIGVLHNKQKNYSKALAPCLQSLTIGKEIQATKIQKNACECLYDAHKGLKNNTKALEYFEQMQILDDSLHAEETVTKLQQIEFNKQVFADSLANAKKAGKLKNKNTTTRNILLGAALLLSLIAVAFFIRWRITRKAKDVIQIEKDRSENLLHNILPEEIAAELKEKGKADARDFDMVSILFTDFKGFTSASAKMSAKDLVASINQCFKTFDGICEKYQIEKIKTIGDAYMAAGGLPVPTDDSAKNTVLAALEMQAFITKLHKEKEANGEHAFEMRVGIHTGPVVAGIVGVKKFQYDIWGDTVNTAARTESSGEVGKVNISQATFELVKDDASFTFEHRGKIAAKGKGEIDMYFVS